MKTTIWGCSRCGETHKDIEVRKFVGDPVRIAMREWEFYATCPEHDEPILLRFEESTEVKIR